MEKDGEGPSKVTYGARNCVATLEDYMSSPHADIDLNPAALKFVGFRNTAWSKLTGKGFEK